MSTAATDSRESLDVATIVEEGIQRVFTLIRNHEEAHQEATRKALAAKREPPKYDEPSALKTDWLSKACERLRSAGVPKHFAGRILNQVNDDIGTDWETTRDTVLKLSEFATYVEKGPTAIDVLWTSAFLVRRDCLTDQPLLGQIKRLTEQEREAWPSKPAPYVRIRLSLPFWLLATDDERERGLHEVLSGAVIRDGKAVKKNPDIIAHASTLGRYGLQGGGIAGSREAHAVVHAMAHSRTRSVLEEYHFDERTRQGVLWKEVAGPIRELPQVPAAPNPSPKAKAKKDGKAAAAGAH